MIDITLIGTAALAPMPRRALTSALMTCNGHAILFDCGEGTQSAAISAHANLSRVDLIALTHYHGDHVFGIPGLLQTWDVQGRERPLFITGPVGLHEVVGRLLEIAGPRSYKIVLVEMPEDGLVMADVDDGWPSLSRLRAFPTEHCVASQGYAFTLGRAGAFMPERARELGVPVTLWKRLQQGEDVVVGERTVRHDEVCGPPRRGLKLVFTGDTTLCDSLVEGARGADLMISEATFPTSDMADLAHQHGHMTFSDAACAARRADVAQLWLAHYSARIIDPRDFLPQATEIFENTVCGYDGMSATLTFGE